MGASVSAAQMISDFDDMKKQGTPITEIESLLLAKYGNSNTKNETMNAIPFENVPPNDMLIWRRDGKDVKIVANIIKEEEIRLKSISPALGDDEICVRLSSLSAALWKQHRDLVHLFLEDCRPDNETLGLDPDHWYEVNLANVQLFSNLSLTGIDELLPGRLFSTRMPRDLKSNPESGEKFRLKAQENKLHTVLILTEKKEYDKYAGADLEEFYRSLGLEIINRPIPDFCIPDQPDMIANIKDVTWALSEGHNVLVHCAGGSGRTGMVIAGVVRNVGVKDPIGWVRRVKSVYIETKDQEDFVRAMPLVLDPRIAEKNPKLLQAITAQHILDMSSSGSSLEKGKANNLSEEDKTTFTRAFDLYDSDKSGYLSHEELRKVFIELGATVNAEETINKMDINTDGKVCLEEYLRVMSFTVKDSAHIHGLGGH
mmetsp:Transcript_9709/g.9790  ORF Transcript_9709/g.9790 Transcript_9709/m.9790 type:complete len:428 (+) Transcript_9709:114-1397(+)|eukprot:CAMPEP_0182417314 /NCGR_PEP_ID=MMETSP1167-20130531/1747_1 /TAXON_ID=2988 /ORGANISM="Mallomonas Sp, Strain CCMP3275" /LENGTH=427 /DNA_ID=CAMNT_0024590759 /DNA_START=88 /DNA_END=1371 /DNA_ORIENTATION=+